MSFLANHNEARRRRSVAAAKNWSTGKRPSLSPPLRTHIREKVRFSANPSRQDAFALGWDGVRIANSLLLYSDK